MTVFLTIILPHSIVAYAFLVYEPLDWKEKMLKRSVGTTIHAPAILDVDLLVMNECHFEFSTVGRKIGVFLCGKKSEAIIWWHQADIVDIISIH